MQCQICNQEKTEFDRESTLDGNIPTCLDCAEEEAIESVSLLEAITNNGRELCLPEREV